MNSSINNCFIISDSNKSPKYNAIFNKINKYIPKIHSWDNKYDISQNKLNKFISNTCNILCSDEMIMQWICHMTLWEHIYNNKLDRILVLDDNVILSAKFVNNMEKIWDNVTSDWDIIFFDKSNKLSGYIISFATVDKIINSNTFNKIQYDLLSTLNGFITDNNLNAIILGNKIITINGSPKISTNNHVLLDPLIEPIFGNINHVVYKMGKIKITYYLLLFSIIAFLIGHSNNNTYQNLFITIFLFQQFIELGYFDLTGGKLETLLFEIVIIILFYVLGQHYIKFRGSV